MTHNNLTRITVRDCIRATAAYYQMSERQLLERTRRAAISRPRQVAMFLATQLTSASLPHIGVRFSGAEVQNNGGTKMAAFDHTTVMYARDMTAARMETDALLRSDVGAIAATLRASAAQPVSA